MQAVLTIILILSGQPEVRQMPVDSLDRCFVMASEFVNESKGLVKNQGDQVAAGCALVKIEADRDA